MNGNKKKTAKKNPERAENKTKKNLNCSNPVEYLIYTKYKSNIEQIKIENCFGVIVRRREKKTNKQRDRQTKRKRKVGVKEQKAKAYNQKRYYEIHLCFAYNTLDGGRKMDNRKKISNNNNNKS